MPNRLPPQTPLFNVPDGLLRILDRDLKLAKIPKVDERGRTVDVHAMRTTFGTHLSRGGVAPRTAQAAMRHSTIDLTMNVYTAPQLLDVAGALDALPALPLNASEDEGDAETGCRKLAPVLAPNPGHSVQTEAFRGKAQAAEDEDGGTDCWPQNAERPANTQVFQPFSLVEITGLEPVTSGLQSRRSPN